MCFRTPEVAYRTLMIPYSRESLDYWHRALHLSQIQRRNILEARRQHSPIRSRNLRPPGIASVLDLQTTVYLSDRGRTSSFDHTVLVCEDIAYLIIPCRMPTVSPRPTGAVETKEWNSFMNISLHSESSLATDLHHLNTVSSNTVINRYSYVHTAVTWTNAAVGRWEKISRRSSGGRLYQPLSILPKIKYQFHFVLLKIHCILCYSRFSLLLFSSSELNNNIENATRDQRSFWLYFFHAVITRETYVHTLYLTR